MEGVLAKLNVYVHKEIGRKFWGLNRTQIPISEDPEEALVPLDPEPNHQVSASYSS